MPCRRTPRFERCWMLWNRVMWFAGDTHVSCLVLHKSLWDPAGIEKVGLMLNSTWGQGRNNVWTWGHPWQPQIYPNLCSWNDHFLGLIRVDPCWSPFSDVSPMVVLWFSLAQRDATGRESDSERFHRFGPNMGMREFLETTSIFLYDPLCTIMITYISS